MYRGLRPPLLSLLRCPVCDDRAPLAVSEIREGEADALREGDLSCTACEASFPVERGVPRVLPDLSDRQRETSESFGYQWQAWARKIDYWKQRCREFMEPFEPAEFGRESVLDAGCGYGRWLAEVADGGGVCVGMDLSDAVFAAADYLAERENCHLVQGDILRPPFAQASFQSVYSIGVLHHLPDGAPPGVRSLAPLVRPGGLFFVWLYGKHRGDDLSNLYTKIRKITSRLPKPLMNVLCALLAIAVTLVFLVPKRILRRFAPTRAFADRLPFHSYRDMPFSELRTDLFDMYATPIEYGYDDVETRAMLEEVDLQDIEVTAYGNPRRPDASWRGWGRR